MIDEGKDAHTVALHIAKTTGILHELYIDKTVEGMARHENLQELLNSIKQFVDNPENDDTSLGAFLQNVSLLTNADQDEDGDTDKVTMMTIHGAKGLEFSHVFVVGMEENLFPSQMMIKNREDLEEERRLFYVAITRAEKKLVLSYAEQRYNWGKLSFCEKSRFIDEIDPRYLILDGRQVTTQRTFEFAPKPKPEIFQRPLDGSSSKSRVISNLKPVAKMQIPPKHVASEDFKASDTSNLKVGDAVEHPKFGFGNVTKMEIQGPTSKAVIVFEGEGEKTLLLSFAKLRIVT